MVSQDKLIKQGIKYTDKLFDEISRRLEQGVKSSDTLESFLDTYHKVFPDKDNPLITLGYDKQMIDIILAETNNHKFSRPAQKELVRVTIENQVGELIRDVGDDIRESVRDIVLDGYNQGLPQDKIAENISNKVSAIKGKRAKAIARTEIARTATISDYVINAERGATHYYVECRNTACPICKQRWLTNPPTDVPEKKGLIGDKKYPMTDTANLPPVHPNCRCVVYFTIEDDGKSEVPEPTPEQLKGNLKPGEREKYNQYKRNIERQRDWLRNNPDASSDEIAKHQKRLKFLEGKFDELRRKALGGKVKGTPKPKATSKPKPKPEPKSEPKPKSKPKTEDNSITRKQLEKGLTPQQLKEYDDITKRINKIEKWLSNDPLKQGHTQSDIDSQKAFVNRLNERLEELRKKALAPKPKEAPKPKKKMELEIPFEKSKQLSKEQLDKMDFKELAEHHGAEYKGVQVYDYDGKKYHTIEQTFSDGRKFTLRFEEGAVKSYTKKGVATPNEIIHEVFKVPEALRIETREIWFKNSQKGIKHTLSKNIYDTIGRTVGGYNTYKLRPDKNGDYNHRIVINPKYFKGGGKGRTDRFIQWITGPEEARSWKMTIFHEFTHSGDRPKANVPDYSLDKEYRKIEREEQGFTWYANKKISESFAEHGGYIAYMEANPSEQNKTIEVKHREDGNIVTKRINYEEYKKMYPKHHEYFMRKFKEGF